ncbi:MAG: hypothetical protein ACR2M1_09785, partial [Gemmatimonadaceae bacterium]
PTSGSAATAASRPRKPRRGVGLERSIIVAPVQFSAAAASVASANAQVWSIDPRPRLTHL